SRGAARPWRRNRRARAVRRADRGRAPDSREANRGSGRARIEPHRARQDRGAVGESRRCAEGTARLRRQCRRRAHSAHRQRPAQLRARAGEVERQAIGAAAIRRIAIVPSPFRAISKACGAISESLSRSRGSRGRTLVYGLPGAPIRPGPAPRLKSAHKVTYASDSMGLSPPLRNFVAAKLPLGPRASKIAEGALRRAIHKRTTGAARWIIPSQARGRLFETPALRGSSEWGPCTGQAGSLRSDF